MGLLVPAITDQTSRDADTEQREALCELEQRLIGWQLGPTCISATVHDAILQKSARELRIKGARFQPPHCLIQTLISSEYDAGRAITPRAIACLIPRDSMPNDFGVFRYLVNLAEGAPALTSSEDAARHVRATIAQWEQLAEAGPREIELTRGDQIQPEPIRWLWPGWLARGKFHLLAGVAGTGKTTLAISIAATISQGAEFPDGWQAPSGSTLIWSGEDDFADSILPRFIASGGDRSKIHFVKGRYDEQGRLRQFDPAADMAQLVGGAQTIHDLALVVVDPVISAVSGDSHKNAETRRALQPLVDLAAQLGSAVVGITHLSKGTQGRDPVERVSGSLAFGALPRVVMMTAKREQCSRLVRAKSNIGPDDGGFEYDLERVLIGVNSFEAQKVIWGQPLQGSARDLMAEVEATDVGESTSRQALAEEWLTATLHDGWVPQRQIEERSAQAGHSMPTVRRAKRSLGVVSKKFGGDVGWCWSLSEAVGERQDDQGDHGDHT
jgi:hypothetical protein